MAKLKGIFPIILAAAVCLSGCSMANGSAAHEPLTSGDVADSEAVIEALQVADVIVAHKKFISWGDEWTVIADDVEIGVIKGQPIYALGDTYSLFTTSGNLVGSEAEGFRLINHRAELYDYKNELRGEIQENISLILGEYEIRDSGKKVLGTAKQQLSFTMKFNILGADGNADYTIDKAAFSLGPKVTVTRLDRDSEVKAIDALWLAVIASEVEDSK